MRRDQPKALKRRMQESAFIEPQIENQRVDLLDLREFVDGLCEFCNVPEPLSARLPWEQFTRWLSERRDNYPHLTEFLNREPRVAPLLATM